MSHKRSKHATRMLATIIVAMTLIVSAWSIWFFPRERASQTGERSFRMFANDVLKSFSVFAPEEPAPDKVNLDDLRSRVFGDSIERE